MSDDNTDLNYYPAAIYNDDTINNVAYEYVAMSQREYMTSFNDTLNNCRDYDEYQLHRLIDHFLALLERAGANAAFLRWCRNQIIYEINFVGGIYSYVADRYKSHTRQLSSIYVKRSETVDTRPYQLFTSDKHNGSRLLHDSVRIANKILIDERFNVAPNYDERNHFNEFQLQVLRGGRERKIILGVDLLTLANRIRSFANSLEDLSTRRELNRRLDEEINDGLPNDLILLTKLWQVAKCVRDDCGWGTLCRLVNSLRGFWLDDEATMDPVDYYAMRAYRDLNETVDPSNLDGLDRRIIDAYVDGRILTTIPVEHVCPILDRYVGERGRWKFSDGRLTTSLPDGKVPVRNRHNVIVGYI